MTYRVQGSQNTRQYVMLERVMVGVKILSFKDFKPAIVKNKDRLFTQQEVLFTLRNEQISVISTDITNHLL